MIRKFYPIFFLIFVGIFLILSRVSGQTLQTIIIPPGATLSNLAIEHGTTISVLMALNPKIKDPNLIYAGEELKVPPPTTLIIIPPGATLWGLAKQYNTAISLLLALNPKIKNPDLIFTGDTLFVPKPTSAPTPALPPPPTPTTTEATTTVSTTTEIKVDIKADGSDVPLMIPYNFSVTLSWTSIDASSCLASGDWTGPKPISGSESTGPLTSSKTFILTCTGPLGSSSDSITINVSQPYTPSAPIPPPPSCQDQYASGAQTYSVTTKTIPKIYQIIVDPLNVNYLASQTVTASISDANGNPITQVLGSAITDTKTVNFNLTRVSGTEIDGVWQGTWTLQDSICQNYQVAVEAKSASGTSRVVLTFK